MIVLIGESASGKSTIEKILVEKYGYKKTISYTTRPPRDGEQNGKDYYFVSIEEFENLKSNNFFAEIGEYNGWYYGTAKEDCTNDKVAVLTPHGLRQMKKIKNIDVMSYYINVPRRDRLIKILERGDNIEEAYRRSLSDVGQFDGIQDEVNWTIDNPNYKKSADKIAKIIHGVQEDYNKAIADFKVIICPECRNKIRYNSHFRNYICNCGYKRW